MKPVLFSLYNCGDTAQKLAEQLSYDIGIIQFHTFPDGETSVIIDSNVKARRVIFLATLDRPNDKVLPLFFASETAKMLGASEIGLIAPYLPYMREDKQFHPGEGITAQYFAQMVSNHFDWLMTIDPHLHRFSSLDKIYTIPSYVLHSANFIADWIRKNVQNPLLIGPDSESEQWVANIARTANASYIILNKTRKGDQHIEVSLPSLEAYKHKTPILVDDIISTGRTMIEPIQQLKKQGMKAPICIAVHALFANDAYENLFNAGADKVITCNTIQHVSNKIDLIHLISQTLNKQLLR
jgi:ribose-phosphate pyrophosphokinase